jgi:ribosome-binding protein aMBF1 (putative translation factor)
LSQIIKQDNQGLSQELAVACNLNIAIIKAYESGTAIPKNNEMNVMTNILDVNLSNK